MKDRFSLSSIKENCQLILFLNWVFNSMQPNYKESPLLKPIVILQTELQRSLLAATVPKTTWTSWLFQVHKVLLWSGKSVTQFTKKITRYHFANSVDTAASMYQVEFHLCLWIMTTVFLEIPHLPLDLEQILHLISLFYLKFFVKNYLVLFWAAMTLSLGDMIFLILVGTGNSDRELIFPNSAGLLLSINCFRLDNSSKSVISLALVTKFWVLQDLGKVLYNLPPSKTFGSNSTTLKILYRLLIFFRTIKTNNAWNYLKMTLTAILEYFLRNPRVTSCKVTSAKCSF